MTPLTFVAAWLAGTFAVILLTALAAWWAKRKWDYTGPDLVERREREGVQVWRSR